MNIKPERTRLLVGKLLWANNHNISKRDKVCPHQANASHNNVLSQDNKTKGVTKTAFSRISKVAKVMLQLIWAA